MPRCLCLMALLVFGGAWLPRAGQAQDEPPRTSPRELVEQGYFEEALAQAQDEMDGGPSLAEMVELLEVRALVHLALGGTEDLRTTLGQLLALAPEYTAPATASPDYAAEVGRARQVSLGALSAEVRAPTPSDSRYRADLVNDPGGLGLRAAIRTRANGGPWQIRDDGTPGDADTQLQAVVLGRQGQVLSEGPAGSLIAPENASPIGDNAEAADLAPPIVLDETAPSPRRRRVVLGVVLGLLAAAGIVTAVVLSQQSETSYLPVVDW